MMKSLAVAGMFCAAAAMAVAPGPALAQSDNLNILIMAADEDQDGVPRGSRVSTRILNELENQLNIMGFNVFDETALTMGDYVQGRENRPDAELIDIARSITRPPIDVVSFYTVFSRIERTDYTARVFIRISGRLLSVHSGRRLGNFEVTAPREWRVPTSCFDEGRSKAGQRECILENVGDDMKILAQDLGAVLAELLDQQVADGGSGGTGAAPGDGGIKREYHLVFNNFTPEEMLEIEEYLVVFSCYYGHRPGEVMSRRQTIWYESCITPARLRRNIDQMLGILDIRARFTMSGNEYSVDKLPHRGQRGPARRSDYQW